MRPSAVLPLAGFLLAAFLLMAGCTVTSGGKTTPAPVPPTIPTTLPAQTPGQTTCGLTTCHGLDLACGTDAPQVCTMEYRIGDRCRQHASCDTSGGGCSLVLSPKFSACRACVEKCQIAAGPDTISASACEEKC
jgi:hypothetical protein